MEVEENKEKFFGKFVWGIDLLRDNMNAAQKRALKLEKEKKMLLLSLSHDIKTPLNSIKLYAKSKNLCRKSPNLRWKISFRSKWQLRSFICAGSWKECKHIMNRNVD